MDTLNHLNQAIEYVEENLTNVISYEEIARIACTSDYHFSRMFSFLSGVTLSEYIRRRKLSQAALDLKNRRVRIIDIAIKYGYQSADSFSRAFQGMHGVLPSEARNENIQLKSYPKMTFQLTIQGGKEMKYRIVEKEAFRIVGFQKRVPIIFHGVNPEIAKMYEKLTPDVIAQLKNLSNIEPSGIVSASTNFSDDRIKEMGELDHYIGVATSKTQTEQFDVLRVEAGTWAVFESVGPFPETLQNVWGRIYSEWFPSSGYESVAGPEIVWHESKDLTSPTYRSEIWIFVKNQTR